MDTGSVLFLEIKMGLLNYTTNIDADKTAQEIAKCLSMHGARAVLTEYDEKEGIVKSLSFKISVNDKEMGFRLPCDWKPVHQVMFGNKKSYNEWDSRFERQKSDRKIQAVKTAWRIVKDWVEAQMALVETEMATTSQVFLPYLVMRDGQTLSEKITENPNFLLGDGK